MWNGGPGGRRYSSDDDEHARQRHPVIEDQQQLDAVSALTSFASAAVGCAPSSSRASTSVNGRDLVDHHYPPQPAALASYAQHPRSGAMGRQYSDTPSQNSTTTSEYARQYHRSESDPVHRAPRSQIPQPTQYYHNATLDNGSRGSYHSATSATYREAPEAGRGSYPRAPPTYDDDYHHRPEPGPTVRRADYHRPQAYDDQHYDDEPMAENVSAAGGYLRATSGPVPSYTRRHEDLASEAPVRPPTSYGRQPMRPSSYYDEGVVPRGPRRTSSNSFPHDEHQGRNPEGRGRPYVSGPRYETELHDDQDDDVPYRRPSVSSELDHQEIRGVPQLPTSQLRYSVPQNEDDYEDSGATYRPPAQPRSYHRGVDGAETASGEVRHRTDPTTTAHQPVVQASGSDSRQHRWSEREDLADDLRAHRHAAQPIRGPSEMQGDNGGLLDHRMQQQPTISFQANGDRLVDKSESSSSYRMNRPSHKDMHRGLSAPTSAHPYDQKPKAEAIVQGHNRLDLGERASRTNPPEPMQYDPLSETDEEVDDGVELEEDEDDEVVAEDDDEHVHVRAQVVQAPVPPARGKPEAAARALAAARLEAEREELQDEERKKLGSLAVTSADPPKKKSLKKSVSPKKSSTKRPTNRKKALLPISSPSSLLTASTARREFLMGEKVPPIKETEYENLKELMTQFCRVPLLAEFSRPVSILHPEVSAAYSKIISHPVDLGRVCRGIRRRQYKNCRDIRLDMWRVFANCVKYNSHPNNKDAVPSFVSIALHLREYFNNLWQEYMLPSDPPQRQAMTDDDDAIAAHKVLKASFAKRDEDRKIRLENSGVLVLSKTFTTKASSLLLQFIENGGCVDGLDTKALFGPGSGVDGREVELVIQRLGQYQAQLEEIAQSGSVEYTLDAFYSDLSKCYTEDVLEDNPAMRNRFSNRIDRFFWKQAVPLHEANSRGVTQSSIWGNLAATIWARESSKKPYWPALCLGILPPAEQREGWHQAVTERNEGRLPEKLRGQLMVAKGRCEQAQKRQSLSYFLVEFLGTHEFIWVRETDIIENFDPNTDPNKSVSGSKKSRSSRSNASNVVGSKTYATALQECVWANEEYENVLQDAFENSGAEDDEDDDEEMDNSFHALAQSDEEADEEGIHGYQYEEDAMAMSDVDEANWLITHDGMLDASTVGRKNAKKRAQAMKKKPSTKKEALAKKEESPKKKRSKSKDKKDSKETEKVKDPKERERQEKKEHRELEKRRKKRLREHEKSLRNEARKKTKRRRSGPNDPDECERGLSHNKRARATAIVKAYLTRMAKQDDCKSLALSGVMTMPAALVDSTGLLGMALAFRAASGELCMPDDGKEQLSKLKPWTTIETEKPKSSTERTENLQKQIELLEKEIGRVRNDTEKRKFLASEYVSKRLLADSVIDADDLAARQNHFKKKKKSTPSKSEQGGDESPDKSEEAAKGRPFEMEDDGVSDRNAEDDAMAQADDQSESDLGESVDVSPDGKHEPGLEDRLEENVAEAMK